MTGKGKTLSGLFVLPEGSFLCHTIPLLSSAGQPKPALVVRAKEK